MTFLSRYASRDRLRRTDRPREDFERALTCTGCGALVACFEATLGATTDDEHRFLDPETYVCGSCLDPDPLTERTT